MSFTFKQFHINDAHCAMKVGTDGVLLGAWANVQDAKKILDIGCGSGLVALMAAQRNPLAHVTGIDIDLSSVNDAQANIEASPFKDHIEVHQGDVLQMAAHTTTYFDCILSNPPYYEEDILPPNAARAQARHTAGGGLTFAALLRAVNLLIEKDNPNASFSVIVPASATTKVCLLATLHNLHLTRRMDIVTRKGKPCKRTLLEFKVKACATLTHDTIILYDNGNERSAAYQELCKEFYLNV
uniref:tRNA1(Val) (adenine(37)-N6)-methyltransferase n=1 Tax=Alloprevotella sp. TaxID=1872471 RepID=UPI003FEF2CE0